MYVVFCVYQYIDIGEDIMIRLAYCDDSPIQRTMVDDWLSDYKAKKGVELEIDTFATGNPVIESSKENGAYDIYILDIVLPDIKGTEIADVVREMNPDSKIIFLTATAAFENKVDAFGYLVKPVRGEQLFEMLDKSIEALS